MKKNYIKPVEKVVKVKIHHHILDGSPAAPEISGSGDGSDEAAKSDDWKDGEFGW